MIITTKFSKLIKSTSYDQLPESVTQKAKECFTDFLGVALRGSETESGKAIKKIIKSDGESTIIGHGRSSAIEAGLANGVFTHSLDLDDGHRLAQLHPGSCVIPAALSMCEARNRTGEELIESILVGYQVAIALGMMVNPEHRRRGFHSTGTCGTLGAAAAACKATELNEVQITNALGLAGTQAAGLLESDHSGSMGKHLHAGKAAQSGILSALLAENGFTGAETILEGNEGFLKSMTGIDPEKIEINSYMEDYKISEVYFKIYPVCRHLHSSIDALLQIVNEKLIKLEEIKEITVSTYKIAAEHDNYHPTSTEALRQSLPVSMTIALLNYYQGLDNLVEFNYPPLNQANVNEISEKILIKTDEILNKHYPLTRPSEVSVFTRKGVYKKMIDLPYGEPEKPLKKKDIEWKFKNLNPEVDVEVFHIIENLNSYDDINQFMDELNSFLIS